MVCRDDDASIAQQVGEKILSETGERESIATCAAHAVLLYRPLIAES
jgi:hypothetical protein